MYNDRMIQAQAETISELNARIARFTKLEEEYRRIKQWGEFYKAMQGVIKRSPTVQNAWEKFLVQLKFAATQEEMKKLDPHGSKD